MPALQSALDQLVPGTRVVDANAVGGGCISRAFRVAIAGGEPEVLFVKQNDESFLDNFRCEWDGLVRLSKAGAIRIPQPIAVGVAAGSAWLISEWVEPGRRHDDFFTKFGRQLAGLHAQTLGRQIGLDRDNYLGAARQPNSPRDHWPEFVAEQRIGYQLRWATEQRLVDKSLADDCQKIIRLIDQLLEGREDSTSLLHGDLWSGNQLCDGDGQPVLIDPAVYHGCREAEFGMLRLFGGCPGEFYDAYQDAFPMPGGWQRRVSVYVLYHLLNHLNLFGSGYLGQCQSTAAEILRY